jgi:hypothetical protein
VKPTKVLLCLLILIFGLAAWAQEQPKVELSIDYSFVRFNPDTFAQAHNLNGAGGSFTYNLNQWFGLKAEFFGYGASTSTFVIPAGNAILPAGGTFAVSGNMFTYLFGPQFKYRAKKVQPFVHALFGGAHSNTYANLYSAAGLAGIAPGNNAFAMSFGGGVDIPITKSIAIRPVQVDYLMTRFGNTFDTRNQNNFRYAGGVTFYLGGNR